MTHPPAATRTWPVAVALAVLGLEALGLVGLIVLYVIELSAAKAESAGRTLASIALFVVGLLILLAMIRAWRRSDGWQRMATLVLNALMIPVGFSAARGWGMWIGGPALLLAGAGVVAALAASGEDEVSPAR
ncbi:MAG TPA: hypothetical protein PKH97_05445 [Tetrasphaera sp.]|uniref:hypothetical protein n=1 Tax=Nostocoides sp. TaxID=1917966 RepID=UPI002B8291FE|nr:hypothetical protein [Tetrasphaera sp.]HNQ06615.1 hypothetical protein [Tetrasphaera sp.]